MHHRSLTSVIALSSVFKRKAWLCKSTRPGTHARCIRSWLQSLDQENNRPPVRERRVAQRVYGSHADTHCWENRIRFDCYSCVGQLYRNQLGAIPTIGFAELDDRIEGEMGCLVYTRAGADIIVVSGRTENDMCEQQ